jgi:hypothetical protein
MTLCGIYQSARRDAFALSRDDLLEALAQPTRKDRLLVQE